MYWVFKILFLTRLIKDYHFQPKKYLVAFCEGIFFQLFMEDFNYHTFTFRYGGWAFFLKQHQTCLKCPNFLDKSKQKAYFGREISRNGYLYCQMTLRNGYGFWVSSTTLQTKPNLRKFIFVVLSQAGCQHLHCYNISVNFPPIHLTIEVLYHHFQPERCLDRFFKWNF